MKQIETYTDTTHPSYGAASTWRIGSLSVKHLLTYHLWLISLGILLVLIMSGCSSSSSPTHSEPSTTVTSTAPSTTTSSESSAASSTAVAPSTKQQYTPSTHSAPSPSSSSSTAVTGNSKANRPIRIGFAMDTLVEERWKKDRQLFIQAAHRLGAEVIVQSANSDDARQIEQAEQMISEGVDVLVIVPHNAEATAAIVNRAHRAGIKVLSYDRLVKNADVDLYVSFDNEQVGRLQAEAITKLVPEGKYVYIGGADTDNNAHMFKQGVFDVLQPRIDEGQIRVVYDQWSRDWKPSNAEINMREALTANHNRIDAVIVANDGTAGGAVAALNEQGLAGRIPIAGQDADLAAIRRIVAGTQTMTVYKPIGKLAEITAEMAVKLAKDESITAKQYVNNGKIEVPSILLSPIEVNRNNINQTVIADGFHSRQEVYGK
ncbi:D-xylose ABC transporter substrate-binding protein [Paenibacillus kandeliae]|uniref:D-xylose ABC transporter substrate-binding protein n=1 Tax=Paenibacillus kandeliae TaxID=3231269 RepID=UPI0034574117